MNQIKDRMPTRVVVFRRANPEENRQISNILRTLVNVETKYVRESPILEGFINLPFIETDTGVRIFGLNDIKEFVDNLKSEQD